MKKNMSILIAVMMVLFLISCAVPGGNDGVTETTPEAALSISGLSYSKSGTIDNFQIEGTIVSTEELDRIDYTIDMKSDDLDFHVSGDKESFLFTENVNMMDMSEMTDIIIDQYDVLYDTCAEMAAVLGVEVSPVATMDCTCYDVAGNSVNFTITYEIVSE